MTFVLGIYVVLFTVLAWTSAQVALRAFAHADDESVLPSEWYYAPAMTVIGGFYLLLSAFCFYLGVSEVIAVVHN